MKGYFIIGDKSLSNKESGIGKKVETQIKAMKNEGVSCGPYLQKSGRDKLPKIVSKLVYALPFTNVSPKWKYDEIFAHADFIYFRRPVFMTYAMRLFLKKCKKKNHKLKVYIEIPTYPYDSEYKNGIFQKYLLLRDRYNRTKLKGLVDSFFVLSSTKMEKNLFNIPVTKFINGYDVKNTLTRIYNDHKQITLTCVGMFGFWHGYERIFKGLSEYYKNGGKRDLIIEMVGGGAELNYYKKLVNQLALNKYVNFHGKLFGKNLDEIYANTDIGIGSLGCYKKNIYVTSDLKTREYFAKGIPVISGCSLDIYSNNEKFDFYREVSNDGTSIDINMVIDFYEYINEKRKHQNVEKTIHNHAIVKFDISNTIKPITDTIKK